MIGVAYLKSMSFVNHCIHTHTETHTHMGFPRASDGKESCPQHGSSGFDPWVRKISCRREWLSTGVLLLGEFHRQSSLARYSPWGHKELDTTERLMPSLFSLCYQCPQITISHTILQVIKPKLREVVICQSTQRIPATNLK